MKKYMENYIKEIDEKIKKQSFKEKDIEEFLIKIKFFQHERLIHLLVTLGVVLFMFLTMLLSYSNPWFVLIFIILFIFTIFYIKHYFFLENNVQYMYKQYDEMIKKRK